MALFRAFAKVAIVALGLGGCSGSTDAFRCSSSGECVEDGRPGTCQPSGWCTFFDANCTSQERYGSGAGDGLADTCLPPSAATDTAAGSGDDAATSTSTTSTTTTTTSPSTGDPMCEDVQPPGPGAAMCGDGVAQGVEDCDQNDLRGACHCANVGLGTPDEPLGCTSRCQYDLSACSLCGNGTIQVPEKCEPTDLNNITCEQLGFSSGTLACTGCAFDTRACVP